MTRPTATAAVLASRPGTLAPPAGPASDSLLTFWQRLALLEPFPVLTQLQPLPTAERSDPYFGVNAALAADNGTAPIMRGIGAATDRLEFRWDQLEPAPGVFDFAQSDALMAQASQWSMQVIVVIDGFPSWLAPGGRDGSGGEVGGRQAAPLVGDATEQGGAWADFLQQLAGRYGQQVAAWEIWNEPNSAAFWSGSLKQYLQLLQTAHAVLRLLAPGVPVLLGGMVNDDGAYLDRLLTLWCGSAVAACPALPFDAVAWHVYNTPGDIPRLAAVTHRLLGSRGLDLPVWVTEANVPVNDPDAPADAVVGPDAVSLDQQAAFVLQAEALGRAAGIERLALYRAADVDDQGHYWGLLRGDWSPRPALLAYRTAAEWLSHSRFLSLSTPAAGVTRVQFCRAGTSIDVLWSAASAPTSVRLPAEAATADLVSPLGTVVPARAQGGAFTIPLPAAPPATAWTVALGTSMIVVAARSVSAPACAAP